MFVMYAWWWSLLQLCCHVEADEVLLGCVFHECMSVKYAFVVYACCLCACMHALSWL